MELCQQVGQRSPLKIKQPNVMLGACHGSLNLRCGCRALLMLTLGTRAGDMVDKTLPRYPSTLLMQQRGSCSQTLASSYPLGHPSLGTGSLQHWGLTES